MADDDPPDEAPTAVRPVEDVEARSVVQDLGPEAPDPKVELRHSAGDGPPVAVRPGTNKYQALRLLGQGGMGQVFLVLDRDLKRRVALKMAKAGSRELDRRFLRESQVLGQLEHPNIVALHELGLTARKRPYYTMRYVRGLTLHQVVRGLLDGEPRFTRSFSLGRLIQIFVQVAQAVGYAHAKGVVHRDLKPGNVMLGEHGEVQVLDWGLAKVLDRGDVETDGALDLTVARQAIGTPRYMAPEQARGEAVDPRTDVYSLGVILYELLTLHPPFDGDPVDVMSRHVREDPLPPRARAPQRSIPRELEAVCLKAMAKAPSARHGDAGALAAEVQAWLEADADRARRRERADERVAEAERRLEAYRKLKFEAALLDRAAEELRRRFKPWQSVEEKDPLFAAEDRARVARTELVRLTSEVVSTLVEALGFDRDHARARALLADHYWEKFTEAEAAGDLATRDYYGDLVARYHDGRRARELSGAGSLTLEADPPGAEATLHRLAEDRLRRVPVDPRPLGVLPAGPIDLPMGSYLVVLRLEGHRDVRLPVHISRNRDWRGRVRLLAESEIGPDFVLVPAGPFLAGGDPEIRGWCLPRSEPELGDFLIARHPVTAGEWAEFRGKRPEGDPRLPAVSLTWHEAMEYCEWRSARDGRRYRLPSELEWEKAARGTDGRPFPWGDRFDPTLCNMRDSRRDGPALLPIDACPADESIYGVRGMAGNSRDWTATAVAAVDGEGGEHRVVRGGAFNLPAETCRAANRFWLAPDFALPYVGLRLARTPGS